jgi:dolichol-phosphate mannosyltransferase
MTYALYIVIQKLVFGANAGWPSLMIAIMFTSGLQMMILGVIGEYLWRAFEQTKNRPKYVINKKM